MNFAPTKSSSTTQVDNSWDGLRTAASKAGLDGGQTATITQSFGLTPKDVIPKVGQIAAAKAANPAAAFEDTVSSVLVSNNLVDPNDAPTKTASAKANTATKKKASGSPGLLSDVFGDFFQVLYPWLMFAFAGGLLVLGMLILLAGIARSPFGRTAVGIASKGALK